MQGLHFRAVDQQGRVHSGFYRAANHSQLESYVRDRGWSLLRSSWYQRVANVCGFSKPGPRWSAADAYLYTLHLSQLLQADVPLIDALKELALLERTKSVRAALQAMNRRVEQGDSLSAAMAASPELFGEEYIATVKAGEASGKLVSCLAQLSENIRWQQATIEQFKTVLAYPLFACLCLLVTVAFVLLYLVPAMMPLLVAEATTLPGHTRVLLWLSDSLIAHWLLILTVLVALLLGIGKVALHRTVYGRVTIQLSLARYARSCGLLYEAGVDLSDALQISQQLIKSPRLREQLITARKQVLAGSSLAQALSDQSLLPALFTTMMSAGERAAVIDVAFRQAADQLQSSARFTIDRIQRLLGPALLLVMGSILLWVVLSVLGPIYQSVVRNGAVL